MNNLLLLITTESDIHRAENIARKLIKRKLAACVSIKEINSFYHWDDQIQHSKEFEISIKSTKENIKDLICILKKEISYEVPQFIYKIFESERNYFE